MIGPLALSAASLLVLLLGASLYRVASGPTEADRMIGLQLVGSSLAAIAILLAIGLGLPRLFDLALVFASLAPTASIIFVAMPKSQATTDMGQPRP